MLQSIRTHITNFVASVRLGNAYANDDARAKEFVGWAANTYEGIVDRFRDQTLAAGSLGGQWDALVAYKRATNAFNDEYLLRLRREFGGEGE